MSDSSRVFFPNLNGLRFVAAALVLSSHIEMIKSYQMFPNMWKNPFVFAIGGLGVTLFFVLSGFLITYLLLLEKNNSSTVSIKKFYLRRVIRIWPLYYLIVIPALFVLPHFPSLDLMHLFPSLQHAFYTKVILFLVILPNVVAAAFVPPVEYASQTWSIGVEEQFYFVWPIIIKYIKNYLAVLVAIIAVSVIVQSGLSTDIIYGANKLFHFYPPGSPSIEELCRKAWLFFFDLRFGCMAIGGIGAYVLFNNRQDVLSVIYSRKFQVFVLLSIVYMFYKGLRICHEFYALFFIAVILNLASNKDTLISLENPVLDYLGNISYGIYMYHMLAITFAVKTVQMYDPTVTGYLSNLVLYILAFSYTILMASASYYLFEKRFLKLKKRLL